MAAEKLDGDRCKRRLRHCMFITALAMAGASTHTLAFTIETSNPDLKLRWDTTAKYSMSWRLQDRSSDIVDGDPGGPPPGPELDDGDLNFDKGVVSNRVDLFSEFDAEYKSVGARVSAAGWYDSVYNDSNDNDSPGTISSTSVPAGEFTDDTRDLMGRDVEILDAFVFLKSDAYAEKPFSVRLGRHSVLYGESLFFGSNGIANAQSPTDLVKLLQVPGSQFKEIIRPVGQLSGQVQVTPNVSLGAYYQFEWEENRLPASGSYLSDVDFVGEGAERVLGFLHDDDMEAKDSGQFGAQMRFRAGDYEFGVYAARYHDKGPQIYLNPVSSNYRLAYPEDITVYGASVSTLIGEANVAAEVSYREDTPLVSAPQIDPGFAGDNDGNPLYAIGDTLHAQVSMVQLFTRNKLWDGASLLAELAWNRRLNIDMNPLAIDPNVTRNALAFRMIFEPSYFQVLPGLDITVPIGLGYNPSGHSSAVFKFNGGVEHGGDFSIGITGNYKKEWKFALNYVNFFGEENAFLTPNTTTIPGPFMQSREQSLGDRDFISISVQTTF
jgi:hypothetical protein